MQRVSKCAEEKESMAKSSNLHWNTILHVSAREDEKMFLPYEKVNNQDCNKSPKSCNEAIERE